MELGSAAKSTGAAAGGVLALLTQIPADVFDALPPVAQAAVVARVVPERLRTLDTASAEAVLAVAQRAMNVLSAVQDLALAACVRREELDLADLDGDWADGSEWRPSSVKIVASSVAPVLCSTPRGAESRVADALCLVEDLPRALAAALDGRVTPRQTGVVVDQAGLVAVDARPAFDAVVMEAENGIELLTPARLRRQCERAAMAIDPDAAHRRAEQGLRDRFVRVGPGLDPGTTWWRASLPARDSMQAWGAVDELAHEYVRADPARSIDQARADAFLDLLLGSAQVSTTVELVVPTFTERATDHRRGGAPAGPNGAAPVGANGAALEGANGAAPLSPNGGAPAGPNGAALPGRHEIHAPDLADLSAVQTGADAPSGREDPRHVPSPVASVDALFFDLAHIAGPRLAPEHAIASELFGLVAVSPAGHHEGADTNVHARGHPVSRPGPEAASAVDPTRTGLVGRPAWRPPELGVRHPRFGWMLSATLAELLSDPDVALRVTRADVLTGITVARDPAIYRPNAALAQRVRDRDRTCRFPGCGVAARRCDLDHVVRFPDGPTTEDNLVCLCRTHHGFKHHAGWTLTSEVDGSCTWTAPTGRSYVTRPADLRLDAA
ncbi:HNH endonuclease signature motif containing protein [Terracoccus sp. 273MFTsu3.1]|uniref:HNH endonuclease signature motif containing protein n=1 Tax=Terracoccus sp. 273MFTsu3.1 TaxID=1172188 RepID=UPI0003819ECB|nr:HNH endonuclease signature motif containing protein [Terracoccus sp. 273MFTsu3.1]